MFLRFADLWKSEAELAHPVPLADGSGPREAEALARPKHGLETLGGPPRRVGFRNPPTPRHGLLHPEVVALDPLLEVLGHVVDGVAGQQAFLPRRREGGRIDAGAICANPVERQQGAVIQYLAEELLGGVEGALGLEQEVDRLAMLVDGAVQLAPLNPDPDPDPDVGLVHADGPTVGSAER